MWCTKGVFLVAVVLGNLACKKTVNLDGNYKAVFNFEQSNIPTRIYLWSIESLLWDNKATEGSGRGRLHTAQPQ